MVLILYLLVKNFYTSNYYKSYTPPGIEINVDKGNFLGSFVRPPPLRNFFLTYYG